MFDDVAAVLRRFSALGATRVFCKPLAENDNSKQQIYLGSSLEAVQMFPVCGISAHPTTKDSNYKAKLNFQWVDATSTEEAKGAQLVLYPQYPEVRLSGFLSGCRNAPNELLRPLPKELRQHNNGSDGRVLFFGVTSEGVTLACLAATGSNLAVEAMRMITEGELEKESVFFNLPLHGKSSRLILLEKLTDIRRAGWHPSVRLSRAAEVLPYDARNGGGYTLEALLGVIPNGRAEPDFMGWEIKAHSGGRITLMTPEPDAGMYHDAGVKAFVTRFGAPAGNDTLYFTGVHKVGTRNEKTGLNLSIRGFNNSKTIIEDVDGAVELVTDAGECVAGWSFAGLMIRWNKKHAQAAYVSYESEKVLAPAYRYLSPALLGEGTDFHRYLGALMSGVIVFDPGSKVVGASTANSRVKARSQFRTSTRHLSALYKQFEQVDI